jgi:ABC-type proline/glycine betaine transport system ATPase subunit
MNTESVNIDFKRMAVAFRKHVLEKALNAGSTIIYMRNGKIIEEDPKNILPEKIVVK